MEFLWSEKVSLRIRHVLTVGIELVQCPKNFLKMSKLKNGGSKRMKYDGIKLVGRESGRGLVPNCSVLRAQVDGHE